MQNVRRSQEFNTTENDFTSQAESAIELLKSKQEFHMDSYETVILTSIIKKNG